MFANNNMVAFAEFDGVGSNKISWFSQDRLVDSSWAEEIKEYARTNPIVVSMEGL